MIGTAVVVLAGCHGGSGSTKAFCNQVRRVPVITDRDQLAVPDAATATANLLTELRKLQTAAPGEVHREVTTMVEVAEAVQRALLTPEGPERDDARHEVEQRAPAWSDASSKVVSYTRRTCGIDLGASG